VLGRSRVQTSCHRVDRRTTVSSWGSRAGTQQNSSRTLPRVEVDGMEHSQADWAAESQVSMISSFVPGTLSRTLAGVEDDRVDARFGMQPPNALLVLVPRAHCRAHPQLPAPGQALETNDCHAVREMSLDEVTSHMPSSGGLRLGGTMHCGIVI